MSSAFEDSVLDFDFNFLQQTSKNVMVEGKAEKQRKAILIAKKKTIATDSLIKKYYAKKEKLDQTEKYLISSKEECKQVCIDYNTALEKCTKLEKDVQLLYQNSQELQEKLNFSENQCKAIQSHANQLQVLVQEHETQIESLKIENQLEKSNTKEQTKSVLLNKNETDALVNHICLLRDIVLGKKKLRKSHKIILQKYEKCKPNSVADDCSASGSSDDEMDDFEPSPPLPPYPEISSKKQLNRYHTTRLLQVLKSCVSNKLEKIINDDNSTTKRIDGDHDSDSGNEIISEDTGRGSSLGSSDIEKCFNSPDYFITDSPLSNAANKEKKNYSDTATSPITVHKVRVEVATSPIAFTNTILNNSVFKNGTATKEIGITADPRDFVICKNIATSPVKNILCEIATSPVDFDKHCSNSPKKNTCDNLTKERECLEVNNSNILNDRHTYDCEVDTILSTMRLDHELITPIPKTPAGVRNPEIVKTTCGYVCQEAAKVGEENEILKASIADLAKEILNIKCLLKNHLILNEDDIHSSGGQHCNDIDRISNTSKTAKPISQSHENMYVMNNEVEDVFENLHIVKDNYQQITPEPEKSLETNDMQNHIVITDQNENEMLREEIIIKDYLHKSPTKTLEKIKRTKKLTRLEKLRKKLLPKSKIRRAKTPPIKKLKRKKQLLFKKKVLEKSIVSLNNKTAYANAVKVMAELKSKEKITDNSILKSSNKSNDCKQEIHIVLSKCDENKDVIPANCLAPTHDLAPLCNITTVITTVNNSTAVNVENSQSLLISPNSITTRSRSKRLSSALSNNSDGDKIEVSDTLQEENSVTIEITEGRKRLKRLASDKSEVTTKRMLRSSNASHISNINDLLEKNNNVESSVIPQNKDCQIINNRRRSSRLSTSQKTEAMPKKDSEDPKLTKIVTYSDLDIFSENSPLPENHRNESNAFNKVQQPKDSILCRMLDKYAKYSTRFTAKKIPENTTNSICKKLEESIAHILTVPQHEAKYAMNNFVNDIQSWNMESFLAGFMKYLKDPARKEELFNKVSAPPAPQMTKSEQVLIYVLKQLQTVWTSVDFVKIVLSNIEYALFQLNHTPEFGTVESLSHFYAVLCRYFRAKSRLRLFILDAMYCIQFKSVALIKQCLEVWMHILPLAHMGIAKSPLVTCLVYLLHFFKCEDKFNRVQEIRDILSRKYFYQVTEWTETKILEMFKNAIKELRDIPVEKKMLRMSLIILAKRRGPQWCQKNLVKNMLLPLIEKDDVPNKVKEFSVSVLGPLLKPYPNDMKVHCEIVVNQLLEMLDRNDSSCMKEAIFSSLLYMRRHNQGRVTQALLLWNPKHVSPELEHLLKDYVREKPAKVWRNTLSRMSVM